MADLPTLCQNCRAVLGDGACDNCKLHRADAAVAAGKSMKLREVYGLMKNGERAFLGALKMTDEEKQRFLNNIAQIYADQERPFNDREAPVFNVGASVYDAMSFAGVQVSK